MSFDLLVKLQSKCTNFKVVLMLRDNEDAWFESFKTMMDYSEKQYGFLKYLRPLSKSLQRFLTWENAMFAATLVSCQQIIFTAFKIINIISFKRQYYINFFK